MYCPLGQRVANKQGDALSKKHIDGTVYNDFLLTLFFNAKYIQ